jgi:hypothetical protein
MMQKFTKLVISTVATFGFIVAANAAPVNENSALTSELTNNLYGTIGAQNYGSKLSDVPPALCDAVLAQGKAGVAQIEDGIINKKKFTAATWQISLAGAALNAAVIGVNAAMINQTVNGCTESSTAAIQGALMSIQPALMAWNLL